MTEFPALRGGGVLPWWSGMATARGACQPKSVLWAQHPGLSSVAISVSAVEKAPGPRRPHLAQGHHELSMGPGKGLLPVLSLDPLCALGSWVG